jgi:hypothetical protein
VNKKYVVAGITLSALLLVIARGPSASAGNASIRNGLTRRIITAPNDGLPTVLPGQILWTYYETTQPFSTCSGVSAPTDCKSGGNGDAILRLINPNGSANTGLQSGAEQTVCAMIYVFDTYEEMGECCGCPLSSAKLANFSVENNLLSNFIYGGANDYGNGTIAIVTADQDTELLTSSASASNGQGCIFGQSGACNSGCDPTDFPGYAVTTDNDLLGSMTHNQYVESDSGTITGITESSLYDDGQGNNANLMYLQLECGVLVGNGSGAGTCNCDQLTQSGTSS